jgi:4-hydroxybenzoate polyprenyltransferase
MNHWNIIILLLCCCNGINQIHSLSIINTINTINSVNNKNNANKSNKTINKIKTKVGGFVKIIRPQNIIPTLFLCFTGGWIVNPSIKNLLSSPTFIVSSFNAVSVMSSSMIINDIFDIEIDKINNPTRPLVTGEITKTDAILYNCFLVGLTEILSFKYLNRQLILFVNLALLNITIYTPLLKRILFIKNISCAALVSFSLFFSGLASLYNTTNIIINPKNRSLLMVAVRTIFFGSLYNELLLDMHDYEGDFENNIPTVPVIYGLQKSWVLATLILKLNILWNSLHLIYLFNFPVGFLLLFILSPLLYNLKMIKKANFSIDSITRAINETNAPLFMLLIYLCMLTPV